MDSIIIEISKLKEMALELSQESGYKYVELLLCEADDDLPACVSFHALSDSPDMMTLDFEEIEAAEFDPFS